VTTIVADAVAGVLCSDSYWFDGNECGECSKIHRVRHELIGLAGDLTACRQWLAAYKKDETLKRFSVVAIRLGKKGVSVWNNSDEWHEVQKRFAIGSGGVAARGALATGATAQQAVRAAITIDANSGGRVRTRRLT
jgi:hypothetical protein